MPGSLESYATQVSDLVAQQAGLHARFLRQRVTEEPDLDFDKLRHAAAGYVEWSARLVQAAAAALEKRRWTSTHEILSAVAADALTTARTTPRRADGAPTLLAKAFYQNAYVHHLNNEQSPLVEGDVKGPLQTGFVLLGESRGKALAAEAGDLNRMGLIALVGDVTAAGEASLEVLPVSLPSLAQVTSGARDLTVREQTLVGRWVYQEFYSSGGFSARSELHMILLDDGHVVRASRAVASSTFRDSAGNWTGFMDNDSGIGPGERGRWSADGRLLTLRMDDASVYEYEYRRDGASLFTENTTGRARRLWTRSRIS